MATCVPSMALPESVWLDGVVAARGERGGEHLGLESAARSSASADARRELGLSCAMSSASSRTSTRHRCAWPMRLAVKRASEVSSSADLSCRGVAKGLKRSRSISAR